MGQVNRVLWRDVPEKQRATYERALAREQSFGKPYWMDDDVGPEELASIQEAEARWASSWEGNEEMVCQAVQEAFGARGRGQPVLYRPCRNPRKYGDFCGTHAPELEEARKLTSHRRSMLRQVTRLANSLEAMTAEVKRLREELEQTS